MIEKCDLQTLLVWTEVELKETTNKNKVIYYRHATDYEMDENFKIFCC